jgi:hypothetical protein
MYDLDDRPTLSDLYEPPPRPFVGVVPLEDGGFRWECGRDDAMGPAVATEALAQAGLDDHECGPPACPECPEGIVHPDGPMEFDTGHYLYRCDAGCGYSG